MSLEALYKKQRDEWNSHVRAHIHALAAREFKVTLAEYKELRMNSYEQETLLPNLDQETLIWCIENCLANIGQNVKRPVLTYDQALALNYVPELLRRIKK